MKQLISIGKRLIPLAIIALLIFLFIQGRGWLEGRENRRQEILARTTAIIWVGTATYRADPEKYSFFRDSVIAASGMKKAEIERLIRSYGESPNKTLPLMRRINKLVDSISRVKQGKSAGVSISDSLAADSGKSLDEI